MLSVRRRKGKGVRSPPTRAFLEDLAGAIGADIRQGSRLATWPGGGGRANAGSIGGGGDWHHTRSRMRFICAAGPPQKMGRGIESFSEVALNTPVTRNHCFHLSWAGVSLSLRCGCLLDTDAGIPSDGQSSNGMLNEL